VIATGGRAIDYAITSAIAVTLPLLVGTLPGYHAHGALVALGAYLVANSAYQGPYGLRARMLFSSVAVVATGTTIGVLVHGQRWLAVVVVSVIVALGAAIPQVGITLGLATLLGAVRPPVGSLPLDVLLETAGGLWLALLFLIPWPHRRLRPFRVAAKDVAEALAVLLEAVTGSDTDWEDRRLAAAAVVDEARAACGLFPVRRDGDDESRQERLLGTLVRIVHEIVALRALVVVLRRQSPGAAPEWEIHTAISVLALRLRRLADAIETAGRLPMGEADPAALRRLAERVERLRRAALIGEGDPVTAALLDQMRRTIERIATDIESAGEVVAGGFKPEFTVPRVPDVRGLLVTLWRTVRTDVSTRSLQFRRVTRTAVATGAAMTIWALLPVRHGYWLPLAVVLCMRHTYGETASRVTQRVGGSVAGAVLAAMLLALAPGKVALLAAIFCGALVAYALRSVSYTLWTTFSTPLILMLVDYSSAVDWEVAAERAGLTVAGGLLALAAARLFWPSGGADAVLLYRLAAMCEAQAQLVRAAAAKIDGSDVPIEKRFATAWESIKQVDESVRHVAEEPVPDEERIAALREVTAAARRIRDDLITLTRLSAEGGVEVGPVPAILDQIADHLEEAADELRAGRFPDVAEPDLDQRLAALDEFLTWLVQRRRAEMASGATPDQLTPVRRTLTQVTAVRHALHALRSDTGDLYHALRKLRRRP
jgi:Tfp pilus assembly major pilin PilA